jgi:hypothetical protein
MKPTFKQRFWNVAKWFIGLFFVLFLFRLLYGYGTNNVIYGTSYSDDFFSSVENIRKNYASEKRYEPKTTQNTPVPSLNAQKYEKTAIVKSKTSKFDDDASIIKTSTKNFNGVIQYEQNTGKKGNRQIHLLIGIQPEKFDSFYLKMQSIGAIKSTEITKIDKTNDYRKLNAKKASLEKTLTSLNELKSRGGAITDYVALHDKILEIETQMQELGVELGNFDSENEFCTIKFSLYEGASEKEITLMQRVKIALEWTIKYYAVLMFSLLGMSMLVFILLVIIDKLKILNKLNE